MASQYTRLVFRLLRVQVMNELQYRANLVVHLFHGVLGVGVGVAMIFLVFDRVPELHGWTRPQLLALVGVFTLVGGLMRMFLRPNLMQLVTELHDGSFDYTLTKPVDTQLLVSARAMVVWQAMDVLTGVCLTVWAATTAGELTLAAVVMFVLALLFGVVIIYCFLLCLATTAFWFVRIDEMMDLFDSFLHAGRWPTSVYPGWLRIGLTFVVPVAFSVTLPAEAITGRLSGLALAGEAVLAVVFFALSRLFFVRALRHYTGASA